MLLHQSWRSPPFSPEAGGSSAPAQLSGNSALKRERKTLIVWLRERDVETRRPPVYSTVMRAYSTLQYRLSFGHRTSQTTVVVLIQRFLGCSSTSCRAVLLERQFDSSMDPNAGTDTLRTQFFP